MSDSCVFPFDLHANEKAPLPLPTFQYVRSSFDRTCARVFVLEIRVDGHNFCMTAQRLPIPTAAGAWMQG